MYALLILNEKNGSLKFMVRLDNMLMKKKIALLLEENKTREAFDLLKAHAEVVSYLPSGKKLPLMPQLTLVEDLV